MRAAMNNEHLQRLLWLGLVAGLVTISRMGAMRLARVIWIKAFDEDPPDDD